MNWRIHTKRAIALVLMVSLISIGFLYMIQDNKPKESSSQEKIQPGEETIQYENVTWYAKDNPHIINGRFIIPQGTRLTIEPGTIIKFTNGSELIVDGLLIAEGNSDEWITFTSNSDNPLKGNWDGIGIYGTDPNKTIIEYCKIEFATHGIIIYLASPVISNNIIVNNSHNGIDIGISSSIDDTIFEPIISYNMISNNGGYGIKCGSNTAPLITNNIIEKNQGKGISIYSQYPTIPIISNNTFRDNRPAIDCGKGSCPLIVNNTIINGSLAFSQYDNIKSNPIINNNSIINTTFMAIYNIYTPPSKSYYPDPNNNNYAVSRVVITRPSDWIINAEYNYWETNNETEIESLQMGKVDFDPWLDKDGNIQYGTGISSDYLDNPYENNENNRNFDAFLIFPFIIILIAIFVIKIRKKH